MTSDDASWQRGEALLTKGAEVFRAPEKDGRLDLSDVLKRLGKRGITRLMVEAGPIVAAAFLQADLVDEAMLLRSPNSIGADGIRCAGRAAAGSPDPSPRLTSAGQEQVGADTIEHFLRS